MSFKYTSEPITIRGAVSQTVLNTYAEETINLNLSTLDREIMVVLRADIDLGNPDSVVGLYSSCTGSIANAAQTQTININNPDTIVAAQKATISDGVSSVAYDNQEPISMVNADDPLYIVATNHLFLGVDSLNATNLKTAYCVLQCRRAIADSSTYAALLTSQLS
jgi:hypothetical protein